MEENTALATCSADVAAANHDELAFGMAGRHMHTPSLQSGNVQAAHFFGGLVVAVVHKHAVRQHMRVNWWQQVLVDALAHALSVSI